MLLKLENIGKIYNSNGIYTIGLRGINLSLDYNEFVVIEGESGSGKSTLMNILGANDSYEEGELYVNGGETSHFNENDWSLYREKYITTIFQDFNIIENLTVLENVMLALFRIDDFKTRKKMALELLERVGLSKEVNQKSSKLSGGEKQRTVIARALAKDSPIILADEPTGNLDVKNSFEIAKLLKDVSKDKLVIVVTHNPEYFSKHSTREIKIFDGNVESDQIKSKPTNELMTSEDVCITNGNKLKNSLNLGLLNYKSRPKFTSMMSLAILVCIVSIFFVYSCISQLMLQPIEVEIDSNPITGKVNIYSDVGVDVTDISDLASDLNANYYITDRKYSEFSFKIQNINSLTDDYEITCLYAPFVYNLSYGNCVLVIPASLSDDATAISDTIINGNVEIDSVTIVETLSANELMLYLSLDNIIDNGNQIKSLFSSMSISGSNTVVHTYEINDELASGEINLVNSQLWDVVGKTVMLEIDTSIYYSIVDDSLKTDGSGLIVQLNEDDYNRIFTDVKEVYEFCFYFETENEALEAISNLPDEYLGVLSISSFYKIDAPDIYIENAVYIVALIACVACLSALIVVIFMRSMQIFKTEFAIYKTLGINDKVARKSFYFQMLLIFAPSLIVIPLVSLAVTLIPSIGLVIIDVQSYIVIEMLVLCVVLIVAFTFSRQVAKQSVRSTLTRGTR